jgi:hypothetical protein
LVCGLRTLALLLNFMVGQRINYLTCAAAWLRREGRAPYWRGTISSLTYEFYEP